MLDFLREQNNDNTSVFDQPTDQDSAAEESVENEQTEPASQISQEYISVSTQESKVRRNTYMLAVVFGIGLLCLWFMIKKSSPQTAAAAVNTEEAKIEAAIANVTGGNSEMFKRMDQIVSKFYEFSNVRQIQVSDLAKNPFRSGNFLGAANVFTAAEENQYTADTMRLLSIMESDEGNCCMIEDKILYEGDLIGDFEVSTIGQTTVRLVDTRGQSEFTELILRLSQ